MVFSPADNLFQELSMPKLRDPNDTKSRIYNKGTAYLPRCYADFRDFRDVG